MSTQRLLEQQEPRIKEVEESIIREVISKQQDESGREGDFINVLQCDRVE